ncbi:major facilitator superfamily domain-containing protein [Earliella scabrosa]|nr:major facilitator superfamily domain-containing protein [Earliella scabrosa]
MSATTVGPHATSRDPEAPPSAHDHDNPHDHDPDDLDATTVAEPRSETVSLTDQTNLLPRKKVMAVFFGLALCILVSCLDSTIVATALPTISAAFDAGSVVSWVPSAYFLTSTAFQPLYGRFSDIFGRKAALCLAMGTFMLGSLAAGFALWK